MQDTNSKGARVVPWGLLSAMLAYIVLRAAILATRFDDTVFVAYERYPMGTIPQILLEGGGFPVGSFYDNAAGQILIGYMAVPLYALLGPSYLVLKLVPALLGLGLVVVVWNFCKSHFDRTSANLAAMLVALGPATLVNYSLFASGNHFENLFFSSLALYCFYRLHSGGNRRLWLVLSGLTAGFAIFVFLGAIIPIGLLVLAHVAIRGARRTLGDLRLGLSSWLVGVAPLIWINLTAGDRGLKFLGNKFGAVDESIAPAGDGARLAEISERLGEFFGKHLLDASTSPDAFGLPGVAIDGVLLACYLVAAVVFLPDALRGVKLFICGLFNWRADADQEEERARFQSLLGAPLVWVLPLTGLAFALSDFRIGGGPYGAVREHAGFRYFNWHLLVSILMVAGAFYRLRSAGGGSRKLGNLLGTAMLLCGLTSLTIPAWGSDLPANVGLKYPGYYYPQVARGILLAKRLGQPVAELNERISRLPKRRQREVHAGIGYYEARFILGFRPKAGKRSSIVAIDEMIQDWPRAAHPAIAYGVGRGLGSLKDRKLSMGYLARTLEPLADRPHLRNAVLEGLMSPLVPPFRSHVEKFFAASSRRQRVLRDDFGEGLARGHGRFCGTLLARGIEMDQPSISLAISSPRKERFMTFFYGLGQGAAYESASAECVVRLLERLPKPAMRARALKGFGAAMRADYLPSELAERLESIERCLTDEEREHVRKGAGLR